MSLLRTSFAACLLAAAPALWAQPQCNFSLGNDIDLCDGETAILSGPAGYTDYLWSTGATTQDIAVTTGGNYTLQITYTTANLAVNGDFSAGNTGFSTVYNYSPNMQVEGNYYIGTNAGTYHPFWQGTANGNFLMVNAGLFQFQWNFWCQTINVCPNTTYTLSYSAANLADVGPAQVQWLVNGVSQGTTNITGFLGAFNTYTTTWTSGPGQTTADFCLRMVNTTGTGHDLGIDDISITGEVIMTDDINVNIIPVPVVDLGPDTAACAGFPINLSVNVPGATYLWSTGSTNNNINANNTGSYWVAVTTPQGCVVRDTVDVTIFPVPIIPLGPDYSICQGTTTTLNATYPGATYLWSNGATTPTITVGPGTWSVTVTANGCTSQDAITIGTYTPAALDLGPDTTLCPGETVFLDASGNGFTYLWQDGSTNNTFFVNQAGTYWVTVTDVNNCDYTDSIDVTYANPVPVELGNDTIICANSGFVLDATTPGATGYSWNTGDTTPTITVISAGFYFVNVEQGNCVVSDFIDIQTLPSPNVNLGPDFSLCPGQTALLDVTAPLVTYVWQDGSTASTFQVSQPGTYWVDVTNNFGCVGTDTVVVSFLGQVTPNLGPDTTICQGTVLQLNGSIPGATGYVWNTGATSATINVTTAGTYWVQANLGGGCSVSDTVNVQVGPVPTVALGNDTTLCSGATLDLDATFPGATYLWSTSATSPTITVNTDGTYWVEVDLNGCTASDTIAVNYLGNLVLDLGNDTVLCQGQVLTLNASIPGGTTTWSTGVVGPTIQVSTPDTIWATIGVSGCTVATATTTGIYWVEVTGGTCATSDTIDVTVVPSPVIDLGNDTTLCAGDQLTLDATWPGATYLWQDGSTGPTFTTGSTGTYYVDVTLGNCTTSDTLTVIDVVQPVADLGNDTLLCDGETLLLDVTQAGASYLWNTGATTPTLTVGNAGTYWVLVSVGSCSAGDTVMVDVVPGNSVDLGPDQVLCPGAQLVLDPGSAVGAVTWQGGSSSATYTVTSGGTYWASTVISGCTVSDTVVVDAVQLATPDLGNDQVLCDGDSAVFEVDPQGASVQWYNGSTATGIVVQSSADVWVTFSLQGCVTGDTIQVTVLTGLALDLGPDGLICPGTPMTLFPGIEGIDYIWSDGSVGQTLRVHLPGPLQGLLGGRDHQ